MLKLESLGEPFWWKCMDQEYNNRQWILNENEIVYRVQELKYIWCELINKDKTGSNGLFQSSLVAKSNLPI